MSLAQVAAFHTHAQLTAELEKLQQAGDGLLVRRSIGKSMEGRDLWVVEVANRRAGLPLPHRPALLVTANLHGVEMAGSCEALHLLSYLVEHARTDQRVRRILDEQVVYVIPRIAVDASDYMLQTGRRVRSRNIDTPVPNVPFPEDLNGDGKILKMRWQSPTGRQRLSEKDPRIMLPRRPGDTDGPFYEVADEGLIHQWDGGRILSAPTYLDFNRNFPAADWRQTALDPAKGTSMHGTYPLSEPETRAVADFVLAHPNITLAVDFHTGNPAVFYPRQTIRGGGGHAADVELIERLGTRAAEITGWPLLSSYTELKTGIKGSETAGGLKDWLYERMGVPIVLLEMGMFYNYLGFSTADYHALGERHAEETSLALLAAHDADPDIGLFTDWTAFDHPQIGPVEIGGWDTVPWSNPPLKGHMEAACARCTEFLLEYADWRPRVDIASLSCEPLAPGLYHLKLSVINTGNLGTSLTEQGRVAFQHAEPQVDLKGDVACVTGRMSQAINHLAPGGDSANLEWLLRAEAGTPVTVTVSSPRGIYSRSEVVLARD